VIGTRNYLVARYPCLARLSNQAQPKTLTSRTDEVIAAIQETVEAFFGGTTWRRPPRHARQCLQLTSDQDIERVVKAVASVLTSERLSFDF
jgi:hypothetical protein